MKLPSPSSYTVPAIVSIALHAGLAVFAFWGWQASSDEKRITQPRYIEAKIVQIQAAAPKAAPPKPQPKVVDVAAQREQAERQRREEEARRQAEQKRKQEAERKKEQERKEQERKKEQERAQQAAERKAQEQKEAEQRRMQEALSEELEAERSRLQAQENEATAQSYIALISDRIERNWSRPPSARNDMQAELSIQLVPTGRVVGVTVVKSSGNAAFDRSAEQAVWKAEQFAELQQVASPVFEQYFRQLRLIFKPEDLRQ